jgi:hypothetical protein
MKKPVPDRVVKKAPVPGSQVCNTLVMVHCTTVSVGITVHGEYTVKKAFQYSRPQPGCYLPKAVSEPTNR